MLKLSKTESAGDFYLQWGLKTIMVARFLLLSTPQTELKRICVYMGRGRVKPTGAVMIQGDKKGWGVWDRVLSSIQSTLREQALQVQQNLLLRSKVLPLFSIYVLHNSSYYRTAFPFNLFKWSVWQKMEKHCDQQMSAGKIKICFLNRLIYRTLSIQAYMWLAMWQSNQTWLIS